MPNLPLTGTAQPLQLTAAQPSPLQQMQMSDLFGQPQQAAPAPQPGMPIPAQATAPDYNALLQQASERDVALQQAAAQYAPNNDYQQGALSAIAALGNIAGAATGKGAVGMPALQLAEQMRQEGRLQQESFFRRVRQEEETIKMERAAKLKAENDMLRAEALRPLVNRIKDPQEQAVMYAAIASGKLDEAQAYLQKYDEIQLEKQRAALDLQLKRELAPYQRTEAIQKQILNTQRIQEGDVDYAAKTGELNALPVAARRELIQKQGKQFNDAVKDDAKIINDYLALDRLVGGFGTEAGKAKLERILGMGGSIRGGYSGTKEERELFAGINKLFGTLKTKDYGASLTATEKPLLDAGLGFSLGKDMFSNTFADAATVNSILAKLGDEMGGKLSQAATGLDPAVLKEIAKDGMPTKGLDNFTQVRQLNREIGGYGNSIDLTPPELKQRLGLSEDEWIKLSPIQKLQLIKSTRTQ